MVKLSLRAVLLLAAISVYPVQAKEAARYRGGVTAVANDHMTVQRHRGGAVILKITPNTKFAYVIPAHLDEIQTGAFVGAAVTGAPSRMTAVEVALIPENMRAGRIPYYQWDPLPSLSVEDRSIQQRKIGRGAPSPALSRLVSTQMTNGLVTRASAGTSARNLIVSSVSGSWRFHMKVPARAPIVRYVLTDRAALTAGSQVMVKTISGGTADLVTIGRGVVPPM